MTEVFMTITLQCVDFTWQSTSRKTRVVYEDCVAIFCTKNYL